MTQINLGSWESVVAGLRCKDGIILAGTKNISYGYLVLSKAGKTVEVIDNVGFAFSGHVSDLQSLVKEIRFEMQYWKYTLDRPLTTSAIAHRLGLLLYSWKLFPYITFSIVGGYDKIPVEGFHLYTLDPVGSVMEEKYAASGTSTEIAIGVIEENYDENMSLEEGKKLILDAMKSVSKRDVLAGKFIDLAIITKSGSKVETIELK
ncbi:MAG: proteasome subunit beta [Candidatus Njordarchaeia archaeon]|nr:proteasome subunit beta [Candidatus Korarchaeota archaeon]